MPDLLHIEPETKRCRRCEQTKPRENFYNDRRSPDGKRAECGDCARESRREWDKKNRDKVNARKRRWRAKYPEVAKRHTYKWRRRYPERHRAQAALSKAIERGKLKRGTECETCGGRDRVEGHHDDYSKPLEVRWLCPPCHEVADAERREAENG